jgi:hypothetical protein
MPDIIGVVPQEYGYSRVPASYGTKVGAKTCCKTEHNSTFGPSENRDRCKLPANALRPAHGTSTRDENLSTRRLGKDSMKPSIPVTNNEESKMDDLVNKGKIQRPTPDNHRVDRQHM